jgi:PAS domain S-box-containing protein
MSDDTLPPRTDKTASSAEDLRNERFRLVVEASPSAIVVTNAAGRIELVNNEAEKLFNYTRNELLGRSVDMLIPDRFRIHHPALRENYIAEPSTRPMGAGRDLYAQTRDGREVPIEIGLNPIHTEHGVLVLASIIDISERKAAEERFREQAQQIAVASRYKSEFLANMSHELRTPLNSILVLSEQLMNNQKGNLTGKQIMHADIIHRSGSDLLALINDILDLSKIEAGRMTVLYETIRLPEFVASIERSFRPMAEARHLRFVIDVEPDVPVTIFSDHQRIFQIIRNLFSNALKFTNEGEIRISLSNAPKEISEQDMISIALSDTGIGIPPDKHDMIFEAFRQLDGSTSRRYGGTGLGLSISRALSTLLDGELSLQSMPGKGSTFTLRLPRGISASSAISNSTIAAATPAFHTAPDAHVDENSDYEAISTQSLTSISETALLADSFQGRRILLVDDDVRNIYAMSSILEELAFDIKVAKNGLQALEFLVSDPDVDVVLMDMMMPIMDGYEATHELKHKRAFAPPVIALTAHAMKGDREKCLAAGADDYLAKPISQADLVAMLHKWID